jgi:V/A-type H+-transporting ATPase subunit D
VNLFEKVKIPEARDNIRRIRIFLGDQQTAAVARAKLAKAKFAGKEGAA